jgi:hypothetical protein
MTRSSRRSAGDANELPERDWKQVRRVHDAGLERYCSRVLQECRDVLEAPNLSAHDRYLRLFEILRERDRDLAGAFDDMRRSRAVLKLAMMIKLDLVTNVELEQFSPSVRESALGIAKLHPEK